MAASLCEPSLSSIPIDIALKIALFLEMAADVCSLGSCSRFWRGICNSDWLWMGLSKRRWPVLDLGSTSRGSLRIPGDFFRFDEVVAHQISPESLAPFLHEQGWREVYIFKHQSLAKSVSALKKSVEHCTLESLDADYFLKAVNDLQSYQFGFIDVQAFLFSKSCNALLNLVGLQYCLLRLVIPPSEVLLALQRSQISEREVLFRWYKIRRRRFYGFRLHGELLSHKITLGELAMGKGDEVLGMLNRGAVHESIRIQMPTLVND